MKAFIHLITVLSLGFLLSTNKTADIYIKKGSHISISGSSNVNCFTCHYTKSIAQGCQEINYEYDNNTFSLKNAEIDLESSAFDCGGKMINKDFNTLMESDEHPHVKINFEQIRVKNNDFEVIANIEIADQINQYTFIISTQDKRNYFGNLELNIEDFGMEAPKKLLGAIKVDPNIVINFDLRLEIE